MKSNTDTNRLKDSKPNLYFQNIEQVCIQISDINSQIQNALTPAMIDHKTDPLVRRLLSNIMQLSSEAAMFTINEWSEVLDKARSLVREALLRNLNASALSIFHRELNGDTYPGHSGSTQLCGAIVQFLREGFNKKFVYGEDMDLSQAKWIVLDHTLYQLNGSGEEDSAQAEIIENCIESGCAIPEKALLYASCFLIDQFISTEGLKRKYS